MLKIIEKIGRVSPAKTRRILKQSIKILPENIAPSIECKILSESINHSIAVFFLWDMFVEVSKYGYNFTDFERKTSNGKELPYCNELMISGLEMKCSKLRNYFVGFENLIRHELYFKKISKCNTTGSNYTLLRKEIEKCYKSIGEDQLIPTVHSVLDTRNAFAHSTVEIGRIKHNNIPLSLSFSRGKFLQNHERYGIEPEDIGTIRFFEEDAFKVSEPLIEDFRKRQHNQLNLKNLATVTRKTVASL